MRHDAFHKAVINGGDAGQIVRQGDPLAAHVRYEAGTSRCGQSDIQQKDKAKEHGTKRESKNRGAHERAFTKEYGKDRAGNQDRKAFRPADAQHTPPSFHHILYRQGNGK